MRKLMRTLVLGAMVAVLSSATAAVAHEATADQAVQEFRAGERATLGQPVSHDEAVQRFRAGERASMTEAAAPDQALQEFRAGERASQAQPATADEPSVARPAERGTPVALLAALAGAAVLALSLDALSVRRKARKATARTAT
jgi:hypothetical protein